jgi:HD-like signal output (HDOD) protein
MTLKLEHLVAATPELAAMPATSSRLLSMLEDPDAPVGDLVSVIEKDTGLTANLLKLCNSAYYGLSREVGSIREALIRLGNRNVVTLAFAASMGRLLQAPVSAYRLSRGQLWRHALAVGLLSARLMPASTDSTARVRAFTAGVVHDLGKLLLDRPLREHLEQLPADLDSRGLCRAEIDLLGFDHAQAGAALAESWNFPEYLVTVIADHHQSKPVDLLTAIAIAADRLVSNHGHDAGAPRVSAEDLTTALANADIEECVAHSSLEQSLRDLDGLMVVLGAGR